MFGIDSPELLVIAVVAMIVIGPKELPGMLRSWGKWMSQMRGMASEFRGHVDEMVRQSELDEVKKQLESAPGLDLQALDPTKEIKSAIQEGMAEGEKLLADAKSQVESAARIDDRGQIEQRSNFDNPLAEPESAPQPGLDAPAVAAGPMPDAAPASTEAPARASEAVAEAPAAVVDEKPARAVAVG